MVGRNDKCPCNSGKKYKKCCIGKAQRSTSMTFKMDSTKADALSVNPSTGKVQLYYKGKKVNLPITTVEQYIPRSKGNKATTKFQSSSNILNPNAVLKEFDCYFALDTNNIVFNDLPLSVTAIVFGFPSERAILNGIEIRYQQIHSIEFWGAESKQELVGWMEAVKVIQRTEAFSKYSSICLIVDSYLGDLEAFNSREKAVVDNWFLPEGFHFVYASSDKKNDSLLNNMMNLADKYSSAEISRITSAMDYEGYIKSDNSLYRYIRHKSYSALNSSDDSTS